jgi:glyoxylase-like metal-dependent hydrolase (beta-lactamase superfamily II)
MNILNVGYDSTNYYLLGSNPQLLVDAGWPGTLPKLLNVFKRKGVALQAIQYLLVTHYHPDHAGLAQELKHAGLKLIVLENQRASIPALGKYMKPEQHYVEISLHDNLDLNLDESRNFLLKVGISGEIVPTPGHSNDSVSLVLDKEGLAFTGDLGMPMSDDPQDETRKSWRRLLALGVKEIYPGHGPVRGIGS